MDQRIFDQLDQLERGARIETRQTRNVYNDSSAEFSAYEGPDVDYHGGNTYEDGLWYGEAEYVDQPMALDSFGNALHVRGRRFKD